jgi:hypothetical protein
MIRGQGGRANVAAEGDSRVMEKPQKRKWWMSTPHHGHEQEEGHPRPLMEHWQGMPI